MSAVGTTEERHVTNVAALVPPRGTDVGETVDDFFWQTDVVSLIVAKLLPSPKETGLIVRCVVVVSVVLVSGRVEVEIVVTGTSCIFLKVVDRAVVVRPHVL